jgi:hypothetical protein
VTADDTGTVRVELTLPMPAMSLLTLRQVASLASTGTLSIRQGVESQCHPART